jgi:hypothetical protein
LQIHLTNNKGNSMRELLEVVAHLCCFILHEVIHPMGIFFAEHGELETNPKYIDLRDWTNQQHCASSSSIEN